MKFFNKMDNISWFFAIVKPLLPLLYYIFKQLERTTIIMIMIELSHYILPYMQKHLQSQSLVQHYAY